VAGAGNVCQERPVLALCGHPTRTDERLLSGVKRRCQQYQWSGHPRKPLLERNREVILSHIGRVSGDSGRYYIDNLTRDCISEIAHREGRPRLVPAQREWLSDWEKRADVPQEWLHMKDKIKSALTAKHDAIVKQKHEAKKKEAEEQQALARRRLYEANSDLIGKFFEIAERKVSVIDAYGEENWDALPQEIATCLTKIAKRNGYAEKKIKEALKSGFFLLFPQEYEWLRKKLDEAYREYHRRQKTKPASSFSTDGLTGKEFETLIGRMLRERGFDVSGTPATGDQGADLIAKRNGKTIIIQAKCYQGSVGNKAVQEVISALAYYGGDEGWVVTNSFFTPSAKALAQKSNVKLIDGKHLKEQKLG
jgi:HJR/Mrr/RecB family endonuclease